MHWFPELQKCAKDLEHEIAGKDINLTPLFKYIEELERSATKINNQIKVDANSDLYFQTVVLSQNCILHVLTA